ncbi:DCC1-like thiol-disulfide oxidoreductase family protein [Nitratireductor sp. XY-223]|uniref:DCC1-like thiol-disulfide oxidoreductase family protein n=1 Tax=Nitratireductor sp. XY-223 TaxID=2561926 RepID=UPI0010A9B1C9|nr:DCC1-like thiol-disulfide oxidoreductase family protein [Nitratireductor sp. XY-223]
MSHLQIVYDGECPFCSRYVTMSRLRDSVGAVELIDARSSHPLIEELKQLGFDLNMGMVARYNSVDYFGADCLHLLSMLSSRVGWLNRIASGAFANKSIARLSYPILRTGRNLTLAAMGRARIT